jgi:SAM-dependent methyltransferase
LRRHYQVERELADRLRCASAAERPRLYRAVYDELFLRVPDHSQLSRKQDPARQQEATERQLRLLGRFLRPDAVYLEVGPGDCHLAAAVARQVRQVYALDVSEEIIGKAAWPANFTPVVFDGVNIDLPPASVDVAYSHQVLEHLHPDDAAEQLRGICRALVPGGLYVCTTPHRFSGPHDISQYFDAHATGFHLKEYTCRDLRRLFRQTGFERADVWGGLRGRFWRLPAVAAGAAEAMLRLCPSRLRRALAKAVPLRAVFDSVTVVGRKAAAPGGR